MTTGKFERVFSLLHVCSEERTRTRCKTRHLGPPTASVGISWPIIPALQRASNHSPSSRLYGELGIILVFLFFPLVILHHCCPSTMTSIPFSYRPSYFLSLPQGCGLLFSPAFPEPRLFLSRGQGSNLMSTAVVHLPNTTLYHHGTR